MINVNVLLVFLVFVILIFFFLLLRNKNENYTLRDNTALKNLRSVINLSVEDGTRIHISIGRSDITSPQAAAAMMGLSLLKQIGLVATDSDEPPIATMGDGTLMVLAQDTIRSNFQKQGLFSDYSNDYGRATGLTPFSYAAGTMSLITEENISGNLLVGSFGPEVGLITSAGERSQTLTIAGTDNIPGQAVLFATAHEPLVGEDLYAAATYLDAGPAHFASLRAQDFMRWLIVIAMVVLAINSLISGLF